MNTISSARRAGTRSRRARSAFSLIEVLVSLALSGVVLTAAGNVLLQSYDTEARYRQRTRAQHDARIASDMVADDLKGAVKFTSMVLINGVQNSMPTGTVVNATEGSPTTVANLDDFTNPLTFDVYSDPNPTTGSTSLRRVRYWRSLDAATGTQVLRREIVNDTLQNGGRTASESATSANAGQIIARGVTRFTAQYPIQTVLSTDSADVRSAKYRKVRLTIEVTQGVAVSRVQTDVTLRNNSTDTF